MVYTADYLMTKTKQRLFTAKPDCRRYWKKHREVRMRLTDHQNVGPIMTLGVISVHLMAVLPSQHSPATQ